MRILAAEPYATLSHELFLAGLARRSRHAVEVRSLPPHHWKWRMRTASLRFARIVADEGPWDLLFASDFLNLAETLAILPPGAAAPPAVVYFHENQLTYPLRPGERRDVHHGLTHVHAILAARRALFNSDYHRRAFLAAAAELLAKAPDVDARATLETLRARSSVLPVGVDVPAGEPRLRPAGGEPPVVLWPHRWEYDKDPAAFLAALVELERRDVPFRLRLLGRRFRSRPPELAEIETRFADRLAGDGFAEDRADYLAALRASDIVVSTARHEFFGLATLEAIRAGALPVLPDDLAYPELLPDDERAAGRFLYARDAPVADALERALRAVRDGRWLAERRRLVASTERFTWDALAPSYDGVFDDAAG